MELYRLEQERKQKLAEVNEKPADAVLEAMDQQEVTPGDSKAKEDGNSVQAQHKVSDSETTQYASSDLSPGLLSNQLLNVNASVLKCAPWEVNIDNWWQNHPDWEPSIENDTHTCLSPIANPKRAEFYRQVHAQQFPELFSEDHYYQCSSKPGPRKIVLRRVADHGFASYFGHTLTESLWSAWRDNRTFQYVHPDQHFRWMYVPENRSSWAWCRSQDHECYFLPISSCDRPPAGSRQELPKKKYLWGDTEPNRTLWEQNIWLSHYIMRPRQELRRHFYEFWKQSDLPLLDESCTWIHVRRGDAMTEKGYERNFYPIQEYLTRGEVNKGDTVLLLTDDQSAIEEATLLHPEYKWVYWNRTRNRGPAAYNSHIPSQDAVLEVMIILAERKLASQCRKGIFGKSNMARMIRNAVVMAQGPANLTMVPIDWKLKRDRVDPEDFMKELDAKLKAARNRSME
jgi:hypothetical protein